MLDFFLRPLTALCITIRLLSNDRTNTFRNRIYAGLGNKKQIVPADFHLCEQNNNPGSFVSVQRESQGDLLIGPRFCEIYIKI